MVPLYFSMFFYDSPNGFSRKSCFWSHEGHWSAASRHWSFASLRCHSAVCVWRSGALEKRKRVVGPLVLQELLMSSVSWSSKSQKLHSSLPSKQHGMCLPTASLSKHEDCTNTAITCCLHNFCCRMFVNPLVAGSMSKCLVKLEGMMTSNEVIHSGRWENPSNRELLPSRRLTYPTWGKGKSSSKCQFGGIC